MNIKEQCPTCSSILRGASGISYCPRCLMDDSYAGLSPGEQPERPVPLNPAELQLSFSEYEIFDVLGAGGMGLVYRARQKKLNRDVALKVVPDNLANPEFGERFEREARTLARLNHPDFVQIYDHGRVDGWFYIAMEFVDGKDLGEILKEHGHLPSARIQSQISRLLESLALAHQQGIIHRDLKPANLLVSGETLKIADFGLAKLQENGDFALSLTGDETAVGTPYYIAPEQRDGSPDVDHRADLYSVGVILYQTITGTLPLGKYEPASKLGAVSPAFDRVISRALQPRPELRFQSALEMKEALDRSAKKSHRSLWVIIALFLVSMTTYWAISSKDGPERDHEIILERSDGFLLDQPGTKTIPAPEDSPDFFGNFTVGSESWLIIGAPDEGFFDGEAKRPGKTYVYRLEENEPVLHQTLHRPNPENGDHFGSILNLSPWGNRLAICSRDQNKVTSHHLYVLDQNDQWQLEQTLTLDLDLAVEDIAPRVILGPEELFVTSPGSIPEEAISIYQKDDKGIYRINRTLIPKIDFNDKAKLGFRADFHDGQLFVTASGYNKGFSMRSGGLLVFEKIEGAWTEVQFLEKPETQAFEYFGFDFAFPSPDRMLVSAIMTKFDTFGSAGSLSEFQRDEKGHWNFVRQINPREPGENQKLFGQQVMAIDGRVLTFSALGSIKQPDLKLVQSRGHLLEQNDDGFWIESLKLDSAGDGISWLGRATTIPGNFVIANPARNEVYLVPVK